MNPYENTDYNYYNYINNVNNSIHNILEIFRLQHETIRINNLYYYNNPNTINPNTINPNTINPNTINPNTINPNTINPIQAIPILNPNHNDNIDNHNDNIDNYNEEDTLENEFQEYLDNLIRDSITSELFCNIENPINRICPITQESFRSYDRVGIINHCNHIFNYNALIRWMRENYICPICRHDIRGINNDSNNDNININNLQEMINNFIRNRNNMDQNRSLIIRFHLPILNNNDGNDANDGNDGNDTNDANDANDANGA